MSFIEKILSGKYPQIEKLFQKEFDKVIEEVFGMLSTDFEELDEYEPPAEPAKPDTVPMEKYDRLNELLQEALARHEATRRELDVVRQERATLQYKLDAAKHELST